VTQGADLLLRDVREKIEKAIEDSASAWDEFVEKNRARAFPDGPPALDEAGPPMVMAVKYVPSSRAKDYLWPAQKRLFIGNKDFTWGKAVYVTGVEEPLSTAIYGRVGLVSYFQPVKWRAFDARDQAKADLYLEWLHLQEDYRAAVLTVHSDHFLHNLRTYFREQFAIDVVLCRPDELDYHPDEFDPHTWYTDPTHTWLAVSDWKPDTPQKELAGGYSAVFQDVRLTIVAEEEFVIPNDPDPALTRPRFPPPRIPQLGVGRAGPSLVFGTGPLGPTTVMPTTVLSSGTGLLAPTSVRQAYWRYQIVRVQS
jgi:hypothetical protein